MNSDSIVKFYQIRASAINMSLDQRWKKAELSSS